MAKRPVSQWDIARELGLSQRAVSFALHGDKGVSSETRKRVVEAAKRMGYRPSLSARALASNRTHAVASLTRFDISGMQFNLNKGLSLELNTLKYHMTYAILNPDELQTPRGAPRLLSELAVDGLVVHMGWEVSAEMVKLVADCRVPAVWINTDRETDVVRPDDFEAGQRAAAKLLAAGHQRILYIRATDPDMHYSSRDRHRGYRQAMQEAGLKPMVLDMPTTTRTPSSDPVDLWRNILERHAEATAYICRDSADAGPLIIAAATMGKRVPRDLSVINFHPTMWVSDIGTPVSTMYVPMYEVGAAAGRMIVQRIDDPDVHPPTVVVPFRGPTDHTIAPPPEA